MDKYTASILESYTLTTSDDLVKNDLELTHTCGAVLADAEAGDTLAVLVELALDHEANC